MKEYKEDEFLHLAGIQHFLFCRRQWALIHIEQQWQENYLTAMGEVMHQKVHNSYSGEKRNDVIISRGMPVCSRELGIYGICDVVEFWKNEDGVSMKGRNDKYQILPVEYKKGKKKEDKSDLMQVVAQAMCLEEMFCCDIKQGELYYGATKHRERIELTNELKEECKKTYQEMHQLYDRHYTPKVKISKKCQACSLKEICLPKMQQNKSAKEYMNKLLEEEK